MDAFAADYLANLTADLKAGIVESAGRRLREALQDDERYRAVERCVQAGILATVAGARTDDVQEQHLLAEILVGFFADADVKRELSSLLRGSPLAMEDLVYLFAQAGYDADTPPGFDLEGMLRTFEIAFLATASEEQVLVDVIQTHALQTLVRQGDEQLRVLRELAAFLKQALPGSVGIHADTITATNVVSGAQIVFRWAPTVSHAHTAIKRGVVTGRDITGTVITGDHNVTYIVDQYYQAGGTSQEQDKDRLRDQIASYLRWVEERYEYIELRGIQQEGRQVERLKLETVYVPLMAEDVSHRDIPLNRILALGNRLVVTGGPGCGKTTVLQYIAWRLTTAILTDPPLAGEQLGIDVFPVDEPAKEGDASATSYELPLPILIPLSAYARRLRNPGSTMESKAYTLSAFISDYLIRRQSGIDLPEDFFERLLMKGRSVILLLDGLDEVPNEDDRALVREAIEDLVTGRDELRIVITCRSVAYRGRTALARGFHQIRVLPLTDWQIDKIIIKAYITIYHHNKDEAKRKARELIDGIKRLERERQRASGRQEPLVNSPLMIRMLLIVHYNDRHLPDHRAELYMRATDAMLLPGYNLDEETAQQIGQLVGGNPQRHQELVQYLAFSMHQRGASQGREIDEPALRAVLASSPTLCPWTESFLALTRQRGTLLEERQGVYRFIHLAFQEYLAARYLAEVRRSEGGIEALVASFREGGLLMDSWWREPVLLVAGYLSLTSPQSARMLLQRLAGADRHRTHPILFSPDEQLVACELAAAACLEWESDEVSLRSLLASRICDVLADEGLMTAAAPAYRAAAGDALARLGDPREEATTLEGIRFCYVPAGPFWMGSGDEDEMARDSEKLLHRQDVPYGYWLGRYPVTVAQYREYVQASGHKPEDADALRGLDNHPVVRVAWHEAHRFCVWLTELWRKRDILPDGHIVRLPTEPEWEKSARGGEQVPREPVTSSAQGGWSAPRDLDLSPNEEGRRRYPWGDAPDPNRANYRDTGIEGTSAVGCFRAGASPYGVEEMSGNVYEWCMTKWRGDYQDCQAENDPAGADPRVVRGGSFGSYEGVVRCACRPGYSPDTRHDVGFRVVVAVVVNARFKIPKIAQIELPTLVKWLHSSTMAWLVPVPEEVTHAECGETLHDQGMVSDGMVDQRHRPLQWA